MAGLSDSPLDWPWAKDLTSRNLLQSNLSVMTSGPSRIGVQPQISEGNFTLGSSWSSAADAGMGLPSASGPLGSSGWSSPLADLNRNLGTAPTTQESSLQIPLSRSQLPALTRHLDGLTAVTKARASISVGPEGNMCLILAGSADNLAAAHGLVNLMLSGSIA
jgi:hypothetical protein